MKNKLSPVEGEDYMCLGEMFMGSADENSVQLASIGRINIEALSPFAGYGERKIALPSVKSDVNIIKNESDVSDSGQPEKMTINDFINSANQGLKACSLLTLFQGSQEELIKEQLADATQLFISVGAKSESPSVYFLQDGLLCRKWTIVQEYFTNEVVQVVVSSIFSSVSLRLYIMG